MGDALRAFVVRRIEQVLRSGLDGQAQVDLFGSAATGLSRHCFG